MPEAVAWRGGLHLRGVLFFRDVFVGEFSEDAQPLGLGAAALECVAKIEIFYRFGELKTEERMIQVGTRLGSLFIRLRQCIEHPARGLDRRLTQFRRYGLHVFIAVKFHFAAQVVLFLIERVNDEAALAARQHIEAAVGVAFENRFDQHGTAGIHDAVIARQDDAELGPVGFGRAHHFSVSFFKDMEGNRAAGKDDKLQREQGEQPGHSAIIAFPYRFAPAITCDGFIERKTVPITGGRASWITGMDNRLKRTPGVYLTGFMGSGKTTVARALAERLGWEFIDLDAEIEAAEATTIAQLFEARGEEEFRRIETEMLKTIMRRIERIVPAVIALGGGTFAQNVNAAMLAGHGVSIWLDCTFETVQQRITEAETRPLARDAAQFRWLYEERRAAYARADFRVDADCDPEAAVEAILNLACWK